MTEYIIKWNAGYGYEYELVDADSKAEADDMAYDAWRQDIESNADHESMLATDELKERKIMTQFSRENEMLVEKWLIMSKKGYLALGQLFDNEEDATRYRDKCGFSDNWRVVHVMVPK